MPMNTWNLYLLAIFSYFLKACDGQRCEDVTGTFYVKIGKNRYKKKRCKQVKKNLWGQCGSPEVREHCPVTCKTCPGDTTCKLRADLQFPETNTEFTGYHEDRLRVEMEGNSEICFSGEKKTSWGCSHKGRAFIRSTESGNIESNGETIRIFNAAGEKLKMGVSHKYNEEEVLQGLDEDRGLANLVIKINGKPLTKSFRHGRNRKKTTHKDYSIVLPSDALAVNANVGFINPEFNGDYFVEIECDESCRCEVTRQEATCQLKAQFKFPTIREESAYGYHAAILSIENEDNEICSWENRETSWCTAYGDTIIAHTEEEYYDYNMAYTAIVPDAKGKYFTMQIEHYDGGGEEEFGYYENGAELVVYANGLPVNGAVISHTRDTPVAPFAVSCDDECSCIVETGTD